MPLTKIGGVCEPCVGSYTEHQTRDQDVMGPIPGRTFMQQLWASCSHTCASVTKQYNLVLAPANSGDALWVERPPA